MFDYLFVCVPFLVSCCFLSILFNFIYFRSPLVTSRHLSSHFVQNFVMEEPWSLDNATTDDEELHYHLVVQLDQWSGLVHVRGSTTTAATVAEEVVSPLSSFIVQWSMVNVVLVFGEFLLLVLLPSCFRSDVFFVSLFLCSFVSLFLCFLLAGGALEKHARFGDRSTFYGALVPCLAVQYTDTF